MPAIAVNFRAVLTTVGDHRSLLGGRGREARSRRFRRATVPALAGLILAALAATGPVAASGGPAGGPGGEAPPRGSEETARVTATRGVVSASAVPGPTSFSLDQTKTGVFRVDTGFDLDRYMYRSDGPLDFSIDLSGNFGPVDASGHPVPGNVLFNKTGRLTLRVFDVDDDFAGTSPNPERDVVVVNGTLLPGALSGADGQWSVNTFRLPLNLLRLPTLSNPNVKNDFQVLIDTINSGPNQWAVQADWAEVRLSSEVLPLAMIHGFGGSSNDFAGMRTYYEQADPSLRGRVVNPGLTARKSIKTNAQLMEPIVGDLMQRSGAYNVNVLAHSKGGLDSRQYAWDHPAQVNRIVMMGTPNGGTRLADIICAEQGGGVTRRLVLRYLYGPCSSPRDGLYQLQQRYVQQTFNKQVLDRRSTTYRTIAGRGTHPLNVLLDGEDDGMITVASVQYLRSDHPTHPGLHEPLGGTVDTTHNGLLSRYNEPGRRALCYLYTAITCPRATKTPGATPMVAAPSASGVSPTIGALDTAQSEGVTVPANGSIELPVRFEGSSQAAVVVLADQAGAALKASLGANALSVSDLLGVPALQASLTSPVDGRLRLVNSGSVAIDAVVLVSVESPRTMTVASTPEITQPGAPVTITAVLSVADPGDAPHAQVFDQDGNLVVDLVLTQGGAGSWSGVFTPTTPGPYSVVASVDGTRPRRTSDLFTVASGGALLAGGFSEQTPDENANGLFDALVIEPMVSVSIPGPYRLAARLIDSAGATVATAGARGSLASGNQTLPLRFSGQDVFRSGLSGPYRVVDAVLSRDNDTMDLEQEVAELGTTAPYNHRLFEHFSVDIDLEAFSDQGLDSNGDGLYDSLQIAGAVSVDAAGSYAINARLVAADGTELGEYQATSSLGEGSNGLTLSFPWQPITAAGMDGPYTVEDLSIYPLADSDTLGYLVLAHQTAAYAASGRVGAVGQVSFAELRRVLAEAAAAGEVDGAGLLKSLQAKVDSAEKAYDRSQPMPARNRLEAFRQELAAQRGKKITETAFLRLDDLTQRLIARL